MGVFWRESEGEFQWVCSGANHRELSSECDLVGIRGCSPVGVFWRESEGAVQWVCSGGNRRVRIQWVYSERESIGCGPVGVFWRESEGAVQWVCSGGDWCLHYTGCVLEGIRGCGPVGVFWRESQGASPMGVFWRESEGVVQWVCSGGNQRVRSSGCVLEGISR